MASLKGPGEAQSFDGSDLRIGIVHARWNTPIIDALVGGARRALLAAGVQEGNVVVRSVPGAWEVPVAVQRLYAASQVQATATASSSGVGGAIGDLLGSSTDLTKQSQTPAAAGAKTAPFDAIIAIGVLIKGETMHFEYISEAVSQGLMRLQLDLGVPVVFGVLTVLEEAQAQSRAGLGKGEGAHNHGEDWGAVAVEMGCRRRGWARGEL
ncbi:MAG: hypothetical protein M1832_005993 [Thelocarpon impressellum]|nr:MAG: hypothetical protein M1832_005993 [Thelocarpon impressellum]